MLGTSLQTVDQGFNIEVRAEPEQNIDEGDGEDEQQQKNEAFIQKVINASATLRLLNLQGERILELPEKVSPKKGTKK
jgi:DNA polymerase II large subunit